MFSMTKEQFSSTIVFVAPLVFFPKTFLTNVLCTKLTCIIVPAAKDELILRVRIRQSYFQFDPPPFKLKHFIIHHSTIMDLIPFCALHYENFLTPMKKIYRS